MSAPSPAGGAEATLAPIDRACATQLAPLRTVVASVYELYPQSLTPRGLQSAARAYAAAGVALRDLSRHVAREDPRSDVKSLSVELAVMARGFRVLADEVSRFGQGDAGASVIGGQAAIEQDAADLAPAARRLRLPACSPF